MDSRTYLLSAARNTYSGINIKEVIFQIKKKVGGSLYNITGNIQRDDVSGPIVASPMVGNKFKLSRDFKE